MSRSAPPILSFLILLLSGCPTEEPPPQTPHPAKSAEETVEVAAKKPEPAEVAPNKTERLPPGKKTESRPARKRKKRKPLSLSDLNKGLKVDDVDVNVGKPVVKTQPGTTDDPQADDRPRPARRTRSPKRSRSRELDRIVTSTAKPYLSGVLKHQRAGTLTGSVLQRLQREWLVRLQAPLKKGRYSKREVTAAISRYIARLKGMKRSGSEASARGSLKTIHTSQQLFKLAGKSKRGKGYYAASLKELGAARLVDELLASGRKQDYTFRMKAVGATGWLAIASPVGRGRHFVINHKGRVHFSSRPIRFTSNCAIPKGTRPVR